jgi:hypothetical protein
MATTENQVLTKSSQACRCGGQVHWISDRKRGIERLACSACQTSTLWQATSLNGEHRGGLLNLWEIAQERRIHPVTERGLIDEIKHLRMVLTTIGEHLSRGFIRPARMLAENTLLTTAWAESPLPEPIGSALEDGEDGEDGEADTDRQQRLARTSVDKVIADLDRASARVGMEG